jgi:hypothetical protein
MNNNFEFEGNGLNLSKEEIIRLFRFSIVSAVLLVLLSNIFGVGIASAEVGITSLVNFDILDNQQTPYYFLNSTGAYEDDNVDISNGQIIMIEKVLGVNVWYDVTNFTIWAYCKNIPCTTTRTLAVSLYAGSYTNPMAQYVYSKVIYDTEFAGGNSKITINLTSPFNLSAYDTLFIEVQEYDLYNDPNQILVYYSTGLTDKYTCTGYLITCTAYQKKTFESWVSMDLIYGKNDMNFQIYGHQEGFIVSTPTPTPTPTPTSTPTPTPTPQPNVTSPSNYTTYMYNQTGNQEAWTDYSNNTVSGWNNSIDTVFSTIDSPIKSMRTGIQSLNTSLSEVNSSLHMNLLVMFVPTIIGAIPAKLQAIFTFYLVCVIILIVLGRS